MNNILSEKEYQHYILDRLQDAGYIIRPAEKFDRQLALDRELLFQFLNDTQAETMASLRKVYKDKLEETLVQFINQNITKKNSSLLQVLKHGVDIQNQHLSLMYTKPAASFNQNLVAKYEKKKTGSPSWKRFGPAMTNGSTWSSSSTALPS